MTLSHYKIIFAVAGLVGVLMIASPALQTAVNLSAAEKSLPAGEKFSEIFLLGPEQDASNYPHNVASGKNYSIYVGVSNHLSDLGYYTVYVKLQNATDALPNSQTGQESPVPPIYDFTFIVEDNGTRFSSLSFSETNAPSGVNQTTMSSISINNVQIPVNKPATLDSTTLGYLFVLVFELWHYDAKYGAFYFDGRFVDLRLNCTQTA